MSHHIYQRKLQDQNESDEDPKKSLVHRYPPTINIMALSTSGVPVLIDMILSPTGVYENYD